MADLSDTHHTHPPLSTSLKSYLLRFRIQRCPKPWGPPQRQNWPLSLHVGDSCDWRLAGKGVERSSFVRMCPINHINRAFPPSPYKRMSWAVIPLVTLAFLCNLGGGGCQTRPTLIPCLTERNCGYKASDRDPKLLCTVQGMARVSKSWGSLEIRLARCWPFTSCFDPDRLLTL